MRDKRIVSVDFIFLHEHLEIEGSAALFFNKSGVIIMSDEEILDEVKVQYGYNAIRVLHRKRARA